MQHQVADLIALCFNKGSIFQITTHSDYFLSRINQLIKLGEIRKNDKGKAQTLCNEFGIPEGAVLDKSKVGVYYFERTGEGKVSVSRLKVTANGIPFASFLAPLQDDRDNEVRINKAFFELNCDSDDNA